jgi:hypothetical protein
VSDPCGVSSTGTESCAVLLERSRSIGAPTYSAVQSSKR